MSFHCIGEYKFSPKKDSINFAFLRILSHSWRWFALVVWLHWKILRLKTRKSLFGSKIPMNSILFGILQCSLKLVKCVRVALNSFSLFLSLSFALSVSPLWIGIHFVFTTVDDASVSLPITILGWFFFLFFSSPASFVFSHRQFFNDDRFGCF